MRRGEKEEGKSVFINTTKFCVLSDAFGVTDFGLFAIFENLIVENEINSAPSRVGSKPSTCKLLSRQANLKSFIVIYSESVLLP